ncbi:heme ABC exporter ATP-binding protein CcmA [Sphingomonas sanguinis]|uniref:heme ABC exporter ATP-binding protein CcmA n=1 Tax=Sphingomonas sp. LC-1 TaxID=3110957 RepID=UPI0021BB7B5A|nr:heme ABC exporter ATP-binding protein CcmA [Sphingomonas sp. LC-1]MCT8000841.1 heme ABC exporter ATP-binding protein CcmA [Sphingomonas sp. LC-1]
MILSLSDVACARGGRLLFARLSLTLAAGEAVVVTGPNGIGKSSLLRLAAGLIAPFEGQVEHRGPTALMAEDLALDSDPSLTGALSFWARLDGRGDPGARVEAALAEVGLAGLAAIPVRFLSTGQRRRAALARVLASGAVLWLLDEPGNGLDTAGLAMLEQAVARHRAGGGAVMLATHQPLAVPGGKAIALDTLVPA